MTPEYDPGELPQEFQERLATLLRAMPGATLASIKPGKRTGSWAVELAFRDRLETAFIIYTPDQVAV